MAVTFICEKPPSSKSCDQNKVLRFKTAVRTNIWQDSARKGILLLKKKIYLLHVPGPTIKFKVNPVDGVTEKQCGGYYSKSHPT